MKQQKGFAHAVVIVGLVVALIGTLGFIFWQNFIDKEPDTKTTETAKPKTSQVNEEFPQDKTEPYDTSSYSFEYPSDTWRVDEETYNPDDPSEKTPVARTDDYKASMGMGIDSGATVGVYVNKTEQSLAEMKENAQKFQGEIENLKDVTVAGEDAFTYSSDYEGVRYHTIFIRDGLSYDLVYQYAGDDESVYMDGYQTIVNSFKLK